MTIKYEIYFILDASINKKKGKKRPFSQIYKN